MRWPLSSVWVLDSKAFLSMVFWATAEEEATTSGGGPSCVTSADKVRMRCRVVSMSATSRSKGSVSDSGK